MRLTFLLNYETASLFAFSLLESTLDKHEVSILYTKDKPSRAPDHPQLWALKEYDRIQIKPLLPLLEKYPSLKANDINGVDLVQLVKQAPELIVSIRHMSILRAEVIKQANHGVLNLHSGLLPEYRGVMASFWAMQNGEENLGSTLHWIEDSEIDQGGIISIDSCPIDTGHSYYWNVLNLYRSGRKQISDAIEAIERDTSLEAKPQIGPGNYYSWPTAKHLNESAFKLFDPKEHLAI